MVGTQVVARFLLLGAGYYKFLHVKEGGILTEKSGIMGTVPPVPSLRGGTAQWAQGRNCRNLTERQLSCLRNGTH